MADEKKSDQTTSTDQKPDETKDQKLAGKFTSVDELEKGYGELEKLSRNSTERLSELEKKYEELVEYQEEPINEVPTGGPNSTTPKDTSKTEVLAKFYADPEGMLKERDEAVRKEARAEMAAMLQTQRTLDTYYRDNPELRQHEDLLEFQFTKQPAKLPIPERLDRAGKRVREMLVAARTTTKEPGSNELNADNYVEGPTGDSATGDRPKEKELSPDDELQSYIKERKSAFALTTLPPDKSSK